MCGNIVQPTDDNITRRMSFSCWITKIPNTHSEYIIVIVFHDDNGYANAPQYYVYTYITYFVTCIMRKCAL